MKQTRPTATRSLGIFSLGVLALSTCLVPLGSSFAQSKRNRDLSETGPQVAGPQANGPQQQATANCICDCVYLKTDRIRNHSYFESLNGESCPSIEGQACLGTLRGETFRGRISECQAAPRKVGADQQGPTWMTLRQVSARQD